MDCSNEIQSAAGMAEWEAPATAIVLQPPLPPGLDDVAVNSYVRGSLCQRWSSSDDLKVNAVF